MRKFAIFSVSFIFLSLAACSWIKPYQPNIQQGNLLSEEMLSQLRTGMTKDQVIKTLGNPILENPYSDDHWAYVYTFQQGGGEIKKKHLDLYFQNNRLIRTEGNYTPI